MANYVKFQRGSLEAYNRLKNKNMLDDNTLYFIYANDTDSVGSLYMGDKIISSGDIVEVAKSLSELQDVTLSSAQNNDFLIFNGTKWINKKLSDIQSLILDGAEIDELQSQITELENKIGHAANPTQSISASGIYTEFVPVTSNRLLTDEQINKLNALIIDGSGNPVISSQVNAANVIGLNDLLNQKANVGDLNTLQSTVSSLQSVVSNDLITKTKYNSEVGDLTQLLNYNSSNPTTLVDEINDINTRLTWQEMSND